VLFDKSIDFLKEGFRVSPNLLVPCRVSHTHAEMPFSQRHIGHIPTDGISETHLPILMKVSPQDAFPQGGVFVEDLQKEVRNGDKCHQG
jgi:hypothetical protein